MKPRSCFAAVLIWLVATPVVSRAADESRAASSQPPGVVINDSPAESKAYIGSPSITVLPNGDYVASHDLFGPGTTFDRTLVFRSHDRGESWQRLTEIEGLFWATLFVHRGELYVLGTNKRYGAVVLRRSRDGGRTWTTPKDRKHGLLLDDVRYHCAPVPVVVHRGRLWRAFEDAEGGGGWGRHFRALVISAPKDADLLDADAWTISNRLPMDPSWVKGKTPGWLEGNVVVAPDGTLVNILRVNDARGDTAAIVPISDDGKTLSFDPARGLIDFPGGRNKFTIRYDPRSQRYWSLANKELDPRAFRNVLALTSSTDLRQWDVRSIILRHEDSRHHAWQYVDWLFDGNDLIAVSRTGWDGSHNAHDANYMTFHRIKDFRHRTMADSPPYLRGEPVRYQTSAWTVEGYGFAIDKLDNGILAFGNRKYVWADVPERFRGWQLTRTDGGVAAEITVRAKSDATLYVATALTQPGTDLSGWKRLDETNFCYTTTGRTRMGVFCRQLKAGEQIAIPQGNWSGTLVLLPK